MPFLGSEALERGDVTRNDLRTRYRALYRDAYLPKDVIVTPAIEARAAWLSTGATLAGVSAAAVLGTKWLDASEPVHLVRADRHNPPGIVAHSWTLGLDEIWVVSGMRVTTPTRTAFDIGRTWPLRQAIPILDALMNATGVKPVDVTTLADARPATRGVRCLRAALELVDAGAESPQETRVRLLLVRAGLPKPETQIEFRICTITRRHGLARVEGRRRVRRCSTLDRRPSAIVGHRPDRNAGSNRLGRRPGQRRDAVASSMSSSSGCVPSFMTAGCPSNRRRSWGWDQGTASLQPRAVQPDRCLHELAREGQILDRIDAIGGLGHPTGAGWRPRTSLPGRASVGTPFSAMTSPETIVAT